MPLPVASNTPRMYSETTKLLDVFGSELLIEVPEGGIQRIPRLRSRDPNFVLWFKFRRIIQA